MTDAHRTEEQRPAEKAPDPDAPVRKGLLSELPNGAKVSGYQLDEGGFQWIFTSATGIKTVVHLSRDATFAVAEIAYVLLYPESKEAA